MNLVPNSLEKKIYTPASKEEMEQFESRQKTFLEEDAKIKIQPDSEKQKSNFEILCIEFRKNHSLENLNAIVDLSSGLNDLFMKDRGMSIEEKESAMENLTPEDKERYKIRTSAKSDLIPIVALMISGQTNPEYKILSQAVGIINSGKIDHTR